MKIPPSYQIIAASVGGLGALVKYKVLSSDKAPNSVSNEEVTINTPHLASAGPTGSQEVLAEGKYTLRGGPKFTRENGALKNVKLKGATSITLPESLTSIGVNAFSGCKELTSIKLPQSLTSIEGNALSGCTGLTSIKLPQSLTSIGGNAFSYCTGLTSITLPQSLTSIEGNAFSGCTKLRTVTIMTHGDPNQLTPKELNQLSEKIPNDDLRKITYLRSRGVVNDAFKVWALASSRNRANWQLTTLKQLRNVLRLTAAFAAETPTPLTKLLAEAKKRFGFSIS